jgi:5'(3')-deoxyribonucleotidase
MIIGVDIDGVLASFNEGFIQRVVDVTGRDLFPPRPFDIPCWDYPAHYGYTPEETANVWDSVTSDSKFWQNLPAYPDTLVSLTLLSNAAIAGHDVYFITSRPGIQAKLQTERWLKRHGYLPTPTVLISSAKGKCAAALQLDKYIDDKWENALDVASVTGAEVYLLNRPWNQRPAMSGINRIPVLADMF